jgi:hypothetical protein
VCAIYTRREQNETQPAWKRGWEGEEEWINNRGGAPSQAGMELSQEPPSYH